MKVIGAAAGSGSSSGGDDCGLLPRLQLSLLTNVGTNNLVNTKPLYSLEQQWS